MKKILLITVSFLFTMPLWAADGLFATGDHCVGYVAHKTMFLFKDSEILGKSCDFNAKLTLAEDQKSFKFHMILPIQSIKSDDETRDEHVFEILSGDQFPKVFFESESLALDAVKEALERGSQKIKGNLTVGGKEYPVEFEVTIAKDESNPGRFTTEGVMKTKFSHFGIDAPKVAGGLVMTAKDEFGLHFRFQSVKIDEIESMLRTSEP